jgi:hypothetical protein
VAVTSLVTPLLLLALAACGDPGTAPGVATAGDGAGATPSATAAAEGDPVKFAGCMREHGVDVQVEAGGRGITVHGRPGDEGKLEEAQKACRQYAPDGGPGGGEPMSQEDQEKFLAFARCMREQGVPMPDPEFDGGRVKLRMGDPSQRIDESKVEAAHEACRSILPEQMRDGPSGGGPGSGGSGGAGGGA